MNKVDIPEFKEEMASRVANLMRKDVSPSEIRRLLLMGSLAVDNFIPIEEIIALAQQDHHDMPYQFNDTIYRELADFDNLNNEEHVQYRLQVFPANDMRTNIKEGQIAICISQDRQTEAFFLVRFFTGDNITLISEDGEPTTMSIDTFKNNRNYVADATKVNTASMKAEIEEKQLLKPKP